MAIRFHLSSMTRPQFQPRIQSCFSTASHKGSPTVKLKSGHEVPAHLAIRTTQILKRASDEDLRQLHEKCKNPHFQLTPNSESYFIEILDPRGEVPEKTQQIVLSLLERNGPTFKFRNPLE